MIGQLINNKYLLIEKISESNHSNVYIAEYNSEKYIAKLLKRDATSLKISDIIRFKNEASIISELVHENIIKFIEFGEWYENYFIISEYIHGKSIEEYISENYKFSIEETINIILQICSGLEIAHAKGIIHRDIKPANVIISTKSNIKIIDFGLSQIKELEKFIEEKEIVGTYSYMSPEQSGILKRTVDERSDLYSLGILFYHIIAGELPFKGNDISSLLHQHIAKIPESPKKFNPQIHEDLNRIILKLIAKDPVNRYQSIAGLVHDLILFKKGERYFDLGTGDQLIKLSYQTDLISRELETGKLLKAYEHLQSGKSSICFVNGATGVGKTRFAREFQKYILENNGLAISGKCFLQETLMPYGVFKTIIDDYIRYLKKIHEEVDNDKQKARIFNLKKKLNEEFYDLGEILLRFNAGLKDFLGEVSPLVSLDNDKEQERFLKIIVNFFDIIARHEKNLVIFFDDVQWIDEGSIKLLSKLVDLINTTPLMIVCLYRDNEVSSEHIFFHLRNKVKNSTGNFFKDEINLYPFRKKELSLFIKKILIRDVLSLDEITDFLIEKSKGNLFFTIEIIRQIIDEKILINTINGWEIDSEKLKKYTVPISLVDVVIRRLNLLEKKEINLLSQAAVMGKEFEIEMLFNFLEEVEDMTIKTSMRNLKIIDKACQLQFIEELYEAGVYAFVHDRVREAFYQMIKPEDRIQLHFKIAQTLEKNILKYKNQQDQVFKIAYHYIECNEEDKILEYAMPAALIAKQNFANDQAIKLFKIITELLIKKQLTGDERYLKAQEYLAEIYLTVGKTDLAIDIYNQIIKRIDDNIYKATIYRHISTAYFKKGDWKNCEHYGKIGLELLGINLKISKAGIVLTIIKEVLKRFFIELFSFYFRNKKKNQNQEKYQLIAWFFVTLNWMYILSDRMKLIASQLKMINISETKLGNSKELAMSMGAYASVLMSIPFFKKSHKLHLRSLQMREDLNDTWGIGQSCQWLGYYHMWCGEYNKSIDYFNTSIEKFKTVGDVRETGMSYMGLFYSYFYLSDYKNALAVNKIYIELTENSADYYGISRSYNNEGIALIEKGRLDEAEKVLLKAFDICQKYEVGIVKCSSFIFLGKLMNMKGDYNKSIMYLENAREFDLNNRFIKHFSIPTYPHLAEAYINQYIDAFQKNNMNSTTLKREKIRVACKEALKKTKKWSTHYGLALNVNARYYTLSEKYKKAEKYFIDSINHNAKHDRKYPLAQAYMGYAELLKLQQKEELARDYYLKAYNTFKLVDTKNYVSKLRNIIGIKEHGEASISYSSQKLIDRQRLSTIIKVSQDISRILNLDELLNSIMSKTIEITGAKTGYILLKERKSGNLEVRVTRNILSEKASEIELNIFSNNIVKQVFDSGESLLIFNASESHTYYRSVVEHSLKSILCIPLKHRDEILGICYLDNSLSSHVFTYEDKELLEVFMAQASIAIENAQVYSNLEGMVQERTQKLKESEKRYKALVSNLPDMVIVHINGMIVYVNNMATQVTGYTIGELIGSNMINFVKEDYKTLVIENLKARIFEESNNDYEIEIIKKTGEFSNVIVRASKIRYENQDAIIAVLTDITDIKYAEKELRQAYNKLKELDELKSSFLSTVSHELRTPLTSVLGFAKLIKMKFDSSILPLIDIQDTKNFKNAELIKSNIDIIVTEGERLTNLINDILDLAKLEAGKVEWKSEEVNIQEVIEHATSATYSLFDEKKIELIKQIQPNLPNFVGDKNRIIQLIINLISNAVKFTEQGSITCMAELDGKNILVKVIDTGIGIEEKYYSEIFEKFKQIENTITNRPKGTGLGLQICKQIVEHHNGQIFVESIVGQGSTFSFTIPIF